MEGRMATRAGRIWNIAAIGTVFGMVVAILGGGMALTLRYGELKTADATMATMLATAATKLSEVDARALLAQQEAGRLQGFYTNLVQRVDQLDNRGSSALNQVATEVTRLKSSYESDLKYLTETCKRIEQAMKDQNAILQEHVRAKSSGMNSPQSDGPLIGRDQDHFEGTAVY
jgi:hypothetical protein